MSKLTKFRLDPLRFCTESKYIVIRLLGQFIMRKYQSIPLVSRFLIDPVEMLLESDKKYIKFAGHFIHQAGVRRREKLFRQIGRPKITVIMAARNSQNTIKDAISSIRQQTYNNWELIVVDDASNDSTLSIAKQSAKEDFRISIVCNNTCKGVAESRNMGLYRSEGDYITFQDADDTSHPERLEHQIFALLSNDCACLCTCSYVRVDEKNRPIKINNNKVMKCVVAMLFEKKPVMLRVGYFKDLIISEDTEYFERIKVTFGESTEHYVFKVLYRARFSTRSLLFSHGIVKKIDEFNVLSQLSTEYRDRLEELRSDHKLIRCGKKSPYVSNNDRSFK